MKKYQRKMMATALAVMMLFSLSVSRLAEAPAAVAVAAGASGTAGATEAADRTDLAAEDYNGTWTLKEIRLDGGYVIPAAAMGLDGSIVVAEGKITITDVYGTKSQHEAAFENGFLYYMEGGERMIVCISTEGLLHIQTEAMMLAGTAEGENPTVKDGVLNMNSNTMEATTLNQYYERAQ